MDVTATHLGTLDRDLEVMAEPKTTRLKQTSLAFTAPAFVANNWLALASAAFAAFATFFANGWLALANWASAQDCGWAQDCAWEQDCTWAWRRSRW